MALLPACRREREAASSHAVDLDSGSPVGAASAAGVAVDKGRGVEESVSAFVAVDEASGVADAEPNVSVEDGIGVVVAGGTEVNEAVTVAASAPRVAEGFEEIFSVGGDPVGSGANG